MCTFLLTFHLQKGSFFTEENNLAKEIGCGNPLPKGRFKIRKKELMCS